MFTRLDPRAEVSDTRCGGNYQGQYCLFIDCWDGSSWRNQVTGSGSVSSSSHFNKIYEEAMIWELGQSSSGNGTIQVTGGQLKGQSLSDVAWEVTVPASEPITGTVQVVTDNYMTAGAVAPIQRCSKAWRSRRPS